MLKEGKMMWNETVNANCTRDRKRAVQIMRCNSLTRLASTKADSGADQMYATPILRGGICVKDTPSHSGVRTDNLWSLDGRSTSTSLPFPSRERFVQGVNA